MKLNKIEIIVVDDNDLLQFLHKTILSMAGLGDDAPAFSDGQEALDYLNQRCDTSNPILVLLDINMPVMNGWEFLDALPVVEGNKNIYVAIVTSSVDEADKIKSQTYPHVIEFLEKPISVEAISKLVEKYQVPPQN